ncbi:MAG: hypothetical protein JWM81_1132 [Candidatus Saccharibacteria bacterium]|nr:hypothetical protein [Candidatus Saccharibacteria bacterium]
MSSIDQEFVEFVVKSLVSNPDKVSVERRIDEKGVLLELTVDPEDLGRVIGKRGATAQSLRTLLRALGTKNEARYNLKIVDNGVGSHGDSTDDGQSAPAPVTSTSSSDDSADDAISAVSVDDREEREDYKAPTPQAEEADDRVSRTRRELAEFDDLDV